MNPTYAGEIRNNYVKHSKKTWRKGIENELVIAEGNHKAVIDQDTWQRAEAIFMSKKRYRRTRNKGTFLLTGILKCLVCGSSAVAGRVKRKDKNGGSKNYKYYQCSKYKNYADLCQNRHKSICEMRRPSPIHNQIMGIFLSKNERSISKIVDILSVNLLVNSVCPRRDIINRPIRPHYHRW